jgi:hypothetical protein
MRAIKEVTSYNAATNEERNRPARRESRINNAMASDEFPDLRPASKPTLFEYIENNPVAAVLQALAVGFAVGMVVRLFERGEKEGKIDVKHRPSLGEAKFHLGSLILPFLWPAWRTARASYGKSAESLREAIDKIKLGDLTSEGKKHLKKLEDWAEREAGHLTDAGKDKARTVEKWVEHEVLPAAECGWRKFRKIFE